MAASLLLGLQTSVTAQEEIEYRNQEVYAAYQAANKTSTGEEVLLRMSSQELFNHPEVSDLSKEHPEFGEFQSDKGGIELIQKRTRFNKTYLNPDGSYTVETSDLPLHVKDPQGRWVTTSDDIVPNVSGVNNEYAFVNSNNAFKSYYPNTLENGIKTEFSDANILEFLDARCYALQDDDEVAIMDVGNTPADESGNEIVYPNVYGPDIDVRITQYYGARKLDYVIHNRSALDHLPEAASYFVFEETIQLPAGYVINHDKTQDLIYVNKPSGDTAATFAQPWVYSEPDNATSQSLHPVIDTNNTSTISSQFTDKKAFFEVTQNGVMVTIKTMVNLEWLRSDQTVYPVIVDPTLYASWGYGWTYDGQNRSATTSGAPGGSEITAVRAYFDVNTIQYYSCGWWSCSWNSFNAYVYCTSWYRFWFEGYDWRCPTQNNFNTQFDGANPNRTWDFRLYSSDGYQYRAYMRMRVQVDYCVNPNITSNPSNTTVCGNNTASFSIGGSGLSPIRWQYSSNNSSWSNIPTNGAWGTSGVTSTTLNLFNPLSNGWNNYYFRARVGNSPCIVYSNSARLTIQSAPTIPSSLSASPDPSCSGGNVLLTANGGSCGGGCTYEWISGGNCGSGQFATTSGNTYTVNPTSNTTYRVRRQGTGACSSVQTSCRSNTVVVNQPPTALTSVTGDQSICNGQSTTLTANGGSNGSGAVYQWFYNSSGCGGGVDATTSGTSHTVSPTTSQWFSVRRKGNSACTNNTTCRNIYVTVYQPPTISGFNSVSQCGTSSYTFTGITINNAGTFGSWSPVTVTSGTATISGTGGLNTLTITPTSSNGSVTAKLNVTGTNECAGTSLTRTFSWTSTPTAYAGADKYVCGNGQVLFNDAVRSTPSNFTWSHVTGSGPGYSWVNGGTNVANWGVNLNAPPPNGARRYRLSVTGTGGCGTTTVTDDVWVRWYQQPYVNASNISSCTGTQDITISGATAGGTYESLQWTASQVSGNGSFVSGSTSISPVFRPTTSSGQYTLTLQAFGHSTTGTGICNGNDPTVSITLVWDNPPISNAGTNIVACEGETVTLSGSSVTGGAFSNVNWTIVGGTASGGTFSNQSTSDPAAWEISTTSSGYLDLQLDATGSGTVCGSTHAYDVVRVTWDPAPVANAGSDIEACSGVQFIPMTGASGAGIGSYNWGGGFGSGSWNQMSSIPTARFTPSIADGTITAVLTVYGTSGACASYTDVDTREITWHTAPVISSVSATDASNCAQNNGQIAIYATGDDPLSYSVNNGSTYQDTSIFYVNLTTGNYNVVVQDVNGCTTTYGSNPVNISGPPPVTATVAVTANNVCAGGIDGSITISNMAGGAGAPFDFSLDAGSLNTWFGLDDPTVIDSLASGTYDVVVRDRFQCESAVYSVTITSPPAIVFNSINVTDITGCGGSGTGGIVASASGGTGTLTYYLNGTSNGTSGSWTGLVGGSYEITVEDANGCVTVANAQINAPWTVTAGNDRYKCGTGSISLAGEIIGALPTDCTPTCSSNCGIPNHCGAQGAAYYAPYMWIDRVRINTLDYYWTGANGYANYTTSGSSAATTDLVVGNTYQLYVRVRKQYWGWPMYTSVYFDWNRDGDFTDAGEWTYMGYNSNTSVWNVYANINVPAGATLGDTRMRVWTTYYSWGNTPANGCGTKAYGEVEDYRVTLTGAPANCSPSYSWSPSGGSSLTGSVNPSSTSTYTLTVNDGAGCVQNDQVTVNVSNETTTTSQQNVDCFSNANGCVTLNATNGIQPYLMYGPSNQVQVYGGSMRPITVTNPNGNTSNHPVKIIVPYSASMRADFGDIRFFDSNQNKLKYWIESYTLSTSAVVWIKMPSLPSGNSTVYMTYGNVSLTSESEGDDVFEFFDDFNSFNASKWTQGTISGTSGTGWSYYGGSLYGGNTNRTLTSTTSFTGGKITEARTYESSSAPNGFTNSGFWASTGNGFTILNHNGTNYLRRNGGWDNFGGWGGGQRNRWIREYIRAYSGGSRVQRTREIGGTIGENEGNFQPANERLRLGARGDNWAANQNFSAQWDWMFVRPCIGVNDATATLGAIQTSDNQFCGFGPGTYNFNVVDVGACNNAVSATITEPTQLSIDNITATDAWCYVDNGTIDITVSGGTQISPPPPYNYSWTGPSSFTSSSEDLTNLASGGYNIIVGDDNGCNQSSGIFVGQGTPLNGAPYFTWTGNTNQDWQIPGNWDCGLPDASSEVIIPANPVGSNTPIIYNGDFGNCLNIDLQGNTIDLLDIQPGGKLRVYE